MVIKVSRQLQTPTLQGSPHSRETYYKVDSVPDTGKVIAHLRTTGEKFDPDTVFVEEITVYKIQF